MLGSYTLEIIAFCIEACHIAAASGADRIELCDNPGAGGTTPSAGMIRKAVATSPIPVFPIIRPRGGDFLYSDAEFEIMQDDVALCRDIGCQGVVLGLLHADGGVDVDRTARLVERASPMAVTFHRAFDRVADPFASLEDVIRSGCRRILTSGCRPTAEEGLRDIHELLVRAKGRIIIMPGSGIRPTNIAAIVEKTGVSEVHSSASSLSASRMTYLNAAMREDLTHPMPSPADVKAMRKTLDALAAAR
jgi:copper homeostasis protein